MTSFVHTVAFVAIFLVVSYVGHLIDDGLRYRRLRREGRTLL